MKFRYYSLDECYQRDEVFGLLDKMVENELLEYQAVERDVIKIKTTGISKEEKNLLFETFDKYDVLEISDYEEDNLLDGEEYYENESEEDW